jgi:uncharacterized protein
VIEPQPETELLLPLFPLPNLVFFPKARLPLHIFEPRYRQMVEEALVGEKQIGMVLLQPGWENDYLGNPSIHPCGTMGTIEQSVLLDDGRYNILLQGEVRFRVVEELPHAPYRLARVRVQPEVPSDPTAAWAEREWLADLSRRYLEYLPGQMDVPEIDTVGLDALTNALIMSLNVDLEEKQRLLELDDPILRARRVGTELQERIESLTFLAPYRKAGDPSRN